MKKAHRALTSVLLLGTVLGQDLYPGISVANHSCSIAPKLRSCPSQDPFKVDSCCVETFGGLVLSTQFWTIYTGLESQGQLLPWDTWTLHGLWPDYCNGSYTQYCDLSRQYDPAVSLSPNVTDFPRSGTRVPAWTGPSVRSFVQEFERYDLLAYMDTYWVSQGYPNEAFWAHEFSKHATCFSNFQVSCYGPFYRQGQELVDFYETAIRYYQRFPTFEWLKQAGITPSNATGVTLADVQGTLAGRSGATPYVGCSGPRFNETAAGRNSSDNGRTVLSEVWYYTNVLGRVQDGVTTPVNATGSSSSCARAKGAVWYYVPSPGSVRQNGTTSGMQTRTTTTSTTTPSPCS